MLDDEREPACITKANTTAEEAIGGLYDDVQPVKCYGVEWVKMYRRFYSASPTLRRLFSLPPTSLFDETASHVQENNSRKLMCTCLNRIRLSKTHLLAT